MVAPSPRPGKKTKKRVPASFLQLNPYPIVEVTLEGDLIYANPPAEEAFPDLAQQGLKHPMFAEWQKMLQPLKREHTLRREIQIGKHWFIQQFILIPDTQRARIYFTPIDELKATQRELEKEKWFDTEKIDQIVTKSNDLLDQQKEIEKTIKKIKKGEWLQNKIEEEEDKIEE